MSGIWCIRCMDLWGLLGDEHVHFRGLAFFGEVYGDLWWFHEFKKDLADVRMASSSIKRVQKWGWMERESQKLAQWIGWTENLHELPEKPPIRGFLYLFPSQVAGHSRKTSKNGQSGNPQNFPASSILVFISFWVLLWCGSSYSLDIHRFLRAPYPNFWWFFVSPGYSHELEG